MKKRKYQKRELPKPGEDSFAFRIRKIRMDRHLSQGQYAIEIGLSVPSVSRLEQGQATPDAELVLRIVEKYKCDLVWLMTGKGDPEGTIGESSKNQLLLHLQNNLPFRAEVLNELGLRPYTEVVRDTRIYNYLQEVKRDWELIAECLSQNEDAIKVQAELEKYTRGVEYIKALLEVGN